MTTGTVVFALVPCLFVQCTFHIDGSVFALLRRRGSVGRGVFLWFQFFDGELCHFHEDVVKVPVVDFVRQQLLGALDEAEFFFVDRELQKRLFPGEWLRLFNRWLQVREELSDGSFRFAVSDDLANEFAPLGQMNAIGFSTTPFIFAATRDDCL